MSRSGHRYFSIVGATALAVGMMTAPGAGAVAVQSTTTPLNSNFETGLAGWTVTAAIGSPPCGWAVDATPVASVSPGSPPNSMNFNDGTDFSNGSAVSGSATS